MRIIGPALFVFVFFCFMPVSFGAGGIELISRDKDGGFSDGYCILLDVTPDGRYALFSSGSTDHVDGDTNGTFDVFLYDAIGGMIERVSLDENGMQLDQNSDSGTISDDGNLVCFRTAAAAISTDDNGVADAYVRNRSEGTTERVSLTHLNGQSTGSVSVPAISGNGQFVVFSSESADFVSGDTNGASDLFRRDIINDMTIRVTIGDGEEFDGGVTYPRISDDGNVIAFISGADNLVPGDTNGRQDTFVRNITAGTTTRVSVAGNEDEGNGGTDEDCDISGDGNVVVFSSTSSNLVPGDTNGQTDIFVRDISAGTTELITITRAGVRSDDYSAFTTISQNGRYVGFKSRSRKLDSRKGGNQFSGFGFDRETGDIACIHFNQNGEEGTDDFGITESSAPYFANNGHIYFDSDAWNLLPADNPMGFNQVFSDFFNPPAFVDPDIALRARFLKKLKKLKKKLKRFKKARKVTKVKKTKKQLKKLKKKIRRL